MQLERMLEQDVRAALRETGHALAVEDIGPLAALNRIARQITHPEAPEELELWEYPMRVGNLTLRPLSLSAWEWLHERAFVWFAAQPRYADLSVPFAMSRPPALLWRQLASPAQAASSLARWARFISATPAALARAVRLMLPGGDGADKDDQSRVDFGPIVTLLAREYGGTPEHWRSEVPAARCLALLRHLQTERDKEAMAAYEATARAASGGRQKVALHHPYTRKVQRLQDYRDGWKALRARWQK